MQCGEDPLTNLEPLLDLNVVSRGDCWASAGVNAPLGDILVTTYFSVNTTIFVI